MDATIKKIPYGMTNFESIICDNYYYVDKTHYITKVENTSRFFFFVRPRRFGKSLF
ncbi:AAA family ATPase [Bacteroides faecis]|nr:AAA family ATPase [Bacteroides faecis]